MDLIDRIEASEQLEEHARVFRLETPAGGGRLSDGTPVWQFSADFLFSEVSIYVTDPALRARLDKRFVAGGRERLVALTIKQMVPDQINATYSRPAYLALALARDFA